MFSMCRLGFSLSLPLLAVVAVARADGDAKIASQRTFQFHYQATVTGLKPGEHARIWLPVPPSDKEQQVQIVAEKLPARGQMERGKEDGNRFLYLEGQANERGEIPLKMTYQVTRHEVRTDFKAPPREPESPKDLMRFLLPNRLVPVGGKTLNLIRDKDLPNNQLDAAHEIYNIVDSHMKYKKVGTGWGRGDAVWACDNGYGNCTDFHSLFMSLVRARKIPAKFTIGFPIPTNTHAGEIPGYHCWAWFHPEGHGWIPVDISEANKDPKMRGYYFGNLTPDRVAFTTGRDLELAPKQSGPPLNFFIYPYVEVNGKPYPQPKTKNHFSFEDVMEK